MGSFTLRIEMHGVSDYCELHEYLRELVFNRLVPVHGVKRFLPHGEYNFVGIETAKSVLDLAMSAAAKTGRKHSIFVTESKVRLEKLGRLRRRGTGERPRLSLQHDMSELPQPGR